MSTFEVQKVVDKKQIKTVKILADEIWTEHFTPIIGSDQVDYMLLKFQSEAAISEQINKGYMYYLISNNQMNIGYMAVNPGNNTLFLSKLYIRSMVRGKGYGRQAIHFLQQLAQQARLKKITLGVNKSNTNTIKAYQALGFKIINSVVKDIGEGFVMDDYQMEKLL
ncbi:MAG: GNAT family N-acetyltransferase [Gammaproteobacteria bacterium]|nr:GNAT family N-acetyltransferase [Gammaproteobacteria bacterium]